jgi:ligand-binding SRPBCC domain-containing protein
MIFERSSSIRAPLEKVFDFFSRPENLALITPPGMGFVIIERPEGTLTRGSRIAYRIKVAGIPLRWVTNIAEWTSGVSFVDEQIRGPYKKWVHTHTFSVRDGEVLMHDRVDYELPFGLLGRIFGGWFVRRQLRGIFDYRQAQIGRLLE